LYSARAYANLNPGLVTGKTSACKASECYLFPKVVFYNRWRKIKITEGSGSV